MSTQPDPYRLRLVKGVTSALQEVNPGNGYYADLSQSVFRGRYWFGESDPLPMVSILESPEPMDGDGPPFDSTTDLGEFKLLIQGFVVDDPANPTDPAYKLLAEVRKRLFLERKKFTPGVGYNRFGVGNSVTEMLIGFGVARPPDDVSAKAYFWLPLTLRVVEDAADPY